MAEVDAKGIGLAAKDIVLGIGTVAAGATMGPGGAEGVSRAGSAIDRILKMVGVLDRRMEAPTAGPPALGDAKIAAEHLRGAGWPDAAVQQILSGPDRQADGAQVAQSVRSSPTHRPFLFERAGYAPDLRDYDADALMLRGVGITTERLKPHEEG